MSTGIKANNLRIGNWLSFFNMIEPERYVQVNARFFCSLANGRPVNELKPDEELSGYYRPIPLTPSILQSAGFKEDEDDDNFDGLFIIQPEFQNIQYKIREFPKGLGIWVVFKGFLSFDHEVTSIKYLHELQNLYYVHQKEELKIQL